MKFFLRFLFFGGLSFLAGCASDQTAAQNEPEKVSTIPWNRPEKWEGGGALGSMMPNANSSTGGFR